MKRKKDEKKTIEIDLLEILDEGEEELAEEQSEDSDLEESTCHQEPSVDSEQEDEPEELDADSEKNLDKEIAEELSEDSEDFEESEEGDGSEEFAGEAEENSDEEATEEQSEDSEQDEDSEELAKKKPRKGRVNSCPLFIMTAVTVVIAVVAGWILTYYGNYRFELTWEHPVFAAVLASEMDPIEIAPEVIEETDEMVEKAIELMAEDESGATGQDGLSADGAEGMNGSSDAEGGAESDGENGEGEEEKLSEEAIERMRQEYLELYGVEPITLEEDSVVQYVPWNANASRSYYYKNRDVRPVSTLYDYKQVEADYFDNSVFIGDSRIAGLADYSGWENASFCYKIGLNVYRMMTDQVKTNDGKETVEEFLSKRQYENVYIMLGVNELGMGVDADFAAKYKENLDIIRELQPEARIIIMSIMYETKEYSDSHDVYNNDNINAKNAAIAELADGKEIFYLDVNPPICDESGGAMDGAKSFDGVHMGAKYYYLWTDYLCAHGY